MKKYPVAVFIAVFGFIAQAVYAVPYFRPFDFKHPQTIIGAAIDPKNLKDSRALNLYPALTHSPADGCLLPSIVCEDWTPIAIGGSINAGKLTVDVAPLANILPWMQAGLLKIVPASWNGIVGVLTPTPGSAPVTFAGGPMFEYRGSENKGYFMLVTALALKF